MHSARNYLSTVAGMVSRVIDGEEDALDNTPENLQLSEQYEKKETIIDLLNDASEMIDSVIEKIDEAVL